MTDAAAEYRREGPVGFVRLNRPATGNLIDRELLLALDRAMIAAEEDVDAKVVVFEAAGADFCAGDASEEPGPFAAGPGAALADALQDSRRFQYLANFPRPTVAVVRGRCAGTGLTLAMCCDFVICSRTALLSDPAVAHGGVPSFALWPFFAWHKTAKAILFGGQLDGEMAAGLGLISTVVDDERLEAEVRSYLDFLLLAPADALIWTKEMISSAIDARGGGRMWRDSAVYHALGTQPA